MTDTVTRAPPFLVDYMVDGRQFSVLLLGPASWAEAEAHLAAIAATGMVEGSDVVEIDAAGLARLVEQWAAEAEALLNLHTAAGAPQEMTLAGAAVMAAGCLTTGLDRTAAAACASAMFDAAYRVEGM
jgi:hypothetical protein